MNFIIKKVRNWFLGYMKAQRIREQRARHNRFKKLLWIRCGLTHEEFLELSDSERMRLCRDLSIYWQGRFMGRPKKSKDTKLVAIRIESEDLSALMVRLGVNSISEAIRGAIKHLLKNK